MPNGHNGIHRETPIHEEENIKRGESKELQCTKHNKLKTKTLSKSKPTKQM